MQSVWAKGLVAVGAVMLGGALAPACAHNDSTVFVAGLLISPPRTSAGGDCAYTPGGALNLAPSFDVSASNTYLGILDVRSQFLSRENSAQVRTETSIGIIKGAVITVTYPDGTQVAPSFTYLTQSVIKSTTADPATGVVAVALLNQPAITELRKKLAKRKDRALAISTVKVFGDTLGGQSFESNEFPIPITLCRGCLMDTTCAKKDLTTGIPDCDIIDASQLSSCVVPCNPGERLTACQLCVDDNRAFCNPTNTSVD